MASRNLITIALVIFGFTISPPAHGYVPPEDIFFEEEGHRAASNPDRVHSRDAEERVRKQNAARNIYKKHDAIEPNGAESEGGNEDETGGEKISDEPREEGTDSVSIDAETARLLKRLTEPGALEPLRLDAPLATAHRGAPLAPTGAATIGALILGFGVAIWTVARANRRSVGASR